jgi:hypothetical protein
MTKGAFIPAKGRIDRRTREYRETTVGAEIPRCRTTPVERVDVGIERIDRDGIPKEEIRLCDPAEKSDAGRYGCGSTVTFEVKHWRDGSSYRCLKCDWFQFYPARAKKNYIPWH